MLDMVLIKSEGLIGYRKGDTEEKKRLIYLIRYSRFRRKIHKKILPKYPGKKKAATIP